MGDMFGGGGTPTPAPATGGGGGFLSGIANLFGGGPTNPGGLPGGTPPFFPVPPGTPEIDPNTISLPQSQAPWLTGPGIPSGGGGGIGGINDILGLVGKGTGLLSTIMALKGAFTQSPYEKLGENMISASNKALKAYTSGKLTTTQQAAVDQFKRQEMARWQQYLASAGIPASSAMVDIQNKIEMDAQVYANQLLEQDFKNALAAMQAGGQVDAASQQALARVGQATNRLP